MEGFVGGRATSEYLRVGADMEIEGRVEPLSSEGEERAIDEAESSESIVLFV